MIEALPERTFSALLPALEMAGIVVFAVSGALVASRKQLDIFGFIVIATVTGIGGGTLRDILLGRLPVFWVDAPEVLAFTAVPAVVVFFAAPYFASRYRLLLWADGLGMGVFAAQGAAMIRVAGFDPVICVLMAGIAATFGGLIRDVICNETPLLLRKEIYITAAFAGAGTTIAILEVAVAAGQDAPQPLAIAVGVLVGFTVRGIGLYWGLSMPRYRSRPGRDYPRDSTDPED